MTTRIQQTTLALAATLLSVSAYCAPFLSSPEGSGSLPAAVAAETLRAARPGTLLEARVGGATYGIAVDQVTPTLSGLRIDGHVKDAPDARIALQVRGTTAVGALNLPGRPLRLGSADGQHWLLDTPAATLEAALADERPELLVARATSQGGAAAGSPLASGVRAAQGEEKPAEVAYPIALNLAELAALVPGAETQLSLPDDRYKITYTRTQVADSGAMTWTGYLSEYGPDYKVVLTYGSGGTTGSVLTPKGELLVQGKPGQEWLIDAPASGLQPHTDENCAAAPPAEVGTGATAAGASAAATPLPVVGAANAATSTTVDLLVLYSPGLVTRLGGEAAAQNRIDYLIALANNAYVNSGVSLTVRKVGTRLLPNLTDTNGNQTTLLQLVQEMGAFAGIRALRNSLGADAVLVVRPFYMNEQGGNCGIGYIGGYGGTPMSAYADLAYSVVSDGTDVKGSGYYCGDYTFTHELGHNMGLMHDRATVASQGGGTGAYSYAYGYGRSGSFGTIMSYIRPTVGKFSNPLDTSCAAQVCGIAETNTANSADNAKALNLTKVAFAAYRASTVQEKVSVAGVVTLQGVAASGVAVLANGTTCATTAANGTYACTMNKGWSGTISASRDGYTFSPASQAFTNLQASTLLNFAGQPATVTVSGTVSVSGKATGGVTIKAGATVCATSGTNGAYRCTLARGWRGAMSATAANTIFSPVSQSVGPLQGSLTLNFAGQPTPVTVSGVVSVSGRATAGVAIRAGSSVCATSAANGAYLCTLPRGWSGTFSASAANTSFTPASQSYASLQANATLNFAGVPTKVTVSGTVSVKGRPAAGASVKANGVQCALTATNGTYACALARGFSGTISVSRAATTFFMASRSVSALQAPLSLNFAGS